MVNRSKTVKTCFILGLLLFSTLTCLVPTSSAGPIVALSSFIDVSWNASASEKPIVPRGGLRTIDLDVRYGITKGWFLADLILPFYRGRQVNIKLEILNYSSWCTPTLKSGSVPTIIQNEPVTLNSQITLTVDVDAPAYAGGFVRMRASVDKIGPIDGFEQEFYLEFTAAYLPLIQTQLLDTNTQLIGPMDTAVFQIQVENLGNARTKVIFEVDLDSLPKDWTAQPTDTLILNEPPQQGDTATAYLTVRPPKSFGYHYDVANIRVKVTPTRAENQKEIGTPEYVTVVVESRGFSFIGLEVVAPIIIIVALAIFLVYFYMRRKKM
jgi:hypothetical protein